MSAAPFPIAKVVPGYLCRAARLVLGLTQQELHVRARVSKKTINDYENGFIEIRVALAERLATALRDAGARFIAAEGYVGVIVTGRKAVAVPSAGGPGSDESVPAGSASTQVAGATNDGRRVQVRRTKRED